MQGDTRICRRCERHHHPESAAHARELTNLRRTLSIALTACTVFALPAAGASAQTQGEDRYMYQRAHPLTLQAPGPNQIGVYVEEVSFKRGARKPRLRLADQDVAASYRTGFGASWRRSGRRVRGVIAIVARLAPGASAPAGTKFLELARRPTRGVKTFSAQTLSGVQIQADDQGQEGVALPEATKSEIRRALERALEPLRMVIMPDPG